MAVKLFESSIFQKYQFISTGCQALSQYRVRDLLAQAQDGDLRVDLFLQQKGGLQGIFIKRADDLWRINDNLLFFSIHTDIRQRRFRVGNLFGADYYF